MHRKSLDGDIWKWGQERLSAGLGAHSPFWKPACLWREVQDKQEPPKQSDATHQMVPREHRKTSEQQL